ncbi:hypothetical protein [Microterricola gilva]|uniref:hypothetical protein n=1 Tax=Microterricola gilva TaxID=393267 RepID=UPI0013EEE2A2|nr:hypothetical protein [Microterricola gilva]
MLASTGFNGLAITMLAVMFLLGGFVLLRWAKLRHAQPVGAIAAEGRKRARHGGTRRRH